VVASELHVLLDILPPLRRHYSKLNEDPAPFPEEDPLRYYKLMVYSAAQRLPEQKCKSVCMRDVDQPSIAALLREAIALQVD